MPAKAWGALWQAGRQARPRPRPAHPHPCHALPPSPFPSSLPLPLQGALDYSGFKAVDMVIEAAIEDIKLKQGIFADLEAACRPDAILSTNTSTINIDLVGAKTSCPGGRAGGRADPAAAQRWAAAAAAVAGRLVL